MHDVLFHMRMPRALLAKAKRAAEERDASASEFIRGAIENALNDDLPIRSVPISGPAVAAMESRKDDGTRVRFTEERLIANFERVGAAVVGSIKQLSAAMQPSIDDAGFLTSKEVERLTSLSRVTIWRLRRAGDFPNPVNLGGSRMGYPRREVNRWLKSRAGDGLESLRREETAAQ